jgi:hypothetical protein
MYNDLQQYSSALKLFMIEFPAGEIFSQSAGRSNAV